MATPCAQPTSLAEAKIPRKPNKRSYLVTYIDHLKDKDTLSKLLGFVRKSWCCWIVVSHKEGGGDGMKTLDGDLMDQGYLFNDYYQGRFLLAKLVNKNDMMPMYKVDIYAKPLLAIR